MAFQLSDKELRYTESMYPQEPGDKEAIRLLKGRLPHLDRTDRIWLSDIIERRIWIERQAMSIAPPKHTATTESETWAASFWYRINFLRGMVAHLRGVGPAPVAEGQALRKSVIV